MGQRHGRLPPPVVVSVVTSGGGRRIGDLLDEFGIRPSRALGQNFVTDPNTVRRIARLAGVGPGDRVLEIGPGLGSLTLALADTGARVTAVEADRHVLPALRHVLAGHPDLAERVTVQLGDAMRVDWSTLLGASSAWVLVANLPYNIATPLLADLLDGVAAVDRMLVMVQREVGLRLTAVPGDPEYGAVSVKVAYWATSRVAGAVPASVFHPRPKVESVLVEIHRRPQPAVDPSVAAPDILFDLVRAGFATRRKMLRRALAGRAHPVDFEAAGIRPEARAEELGVADWGRLAAAVTVRRGSDR